MGRYNEVQHSTIKTVSYEGGDVYQKRIEDEWSNMLFSMMLQRDGFYESSSEQEQRFIDLTVKMIDLKGPEFVAKAAVYTRNVLGLRTISELTAGILNNVPFDTKRQFYSTYFHRPDGIGEVFGVIDKFGQKRSHALIRGVADYLGTLDEYQLGKYPMTKHKYTLHRIINVTHPRSAAIDAYQRGQIKSVDTWESAIRPGITEEQKSVEWKRFVESESLGYMALLKNLNNIFKYCCQDSSSTAWLKEYLVPQITAENKIRKSLVFPYRIYTAWKVVSDNCPIFVESALETAFLISVNNMPKLDGNTAVLLDVSGSMDHSYNNLLSIKEISAVYAVALWASNPDSCKFFKFGTDAKQFTFSLATPPFKLIQQYQNNEGLGFGTEIAPAFELLDTHYDRMFIFSDMQVMDRGGYSSYSKSAQKAFTEYRDKFGACNLYSFDLGNYASQIVSQNMSIRYITSLSDQTFKAIDLIESDGRSLVDIVQDFTY